MAKVTLQLHRIMQNATDDDQRWIDETIDEEVSRSLHNAIGTSRTLAASAKMPTAYVGAQLWPRKAARASGLARDIKQCGDD